jgi:hypothetical protein
MIRISLLISMYVQPESGGGAMSAFNRALILHKIGYSVFVLCGFPSNPSGKVNQEGDKIGIFVDNAYEDLSVKNKTVVDIGGNIAVSAIYFALCGANKIVCIEPLPKNYELARKNIQFNNFHIK